jgi:CHASE3 domain sensor protein
MNNDDVEERMRDLRNNSDYHARAIREVIDSQLDRQAAAQLNSSGGGGIVLDAIINILNQHITLEQTNERD